MWEKLYDFNLGRLSIVGYSLLLLCLLLALAFGIPAFLMLYSEFRGKGVVAIPILGGATILVGGFYFGSQLLRNAGFAVYRWPVGKVCVIGRRTRALKIEMNTMRPFPDETELVTGDIVVFGQDVTESLDDMNETHRTKLTTTLRSSASTIFWVIVNSKNVESIDQIQMIAKKAKAFVRNESGEHEPDVVFAVDAEELSGIKKMKILFGLPAVIEAINSTALAENSKVASGLPATKNKDAETATPSGNESITKKELGHSRLLRKATMLLLSLFAAVYFFGTLDYLFSSLWSNFILGIIFSAIALVVAGWFYAFGRGYRLSFVAGIGVAAMHGILAVAIWADKTFGLKLIPENRILNYEQRINIVVIVIPVVLSGLCWFNNRRCNSDQVSEFNAD